MANDPFAANNQTSQTAAIVTSGAPSALSALYCANSNQYLLSGTGDGTLFWYKNITDALPFTYGPAATTAETPVNNTYYAGLNDFTANAGPATKNVFTGGGYNQFTPAIKVYTAVPVIIQSARLYIGNPGVVTFNVTNKNGQTVASTTINAAATRSNPQPGATADDPNDQGRVYNLNLLLPAPGSYTITPVYDADVTLYRNNAGVTAYPFKAGNLFSITGNDAEPTTGTDSTFYKGFYYYLYDINIKSAGCVSISRQSVTSSKLAITQAGNVLSASTASSTFAAAYQWYLNGQPISGAVTKTYTASQSGSYMVATTLTTGCIVQSEPFIYTLTVLHPDPNSEIGLVTFPEPADKVLNVAFLVKTTDELTLSLVNSKGAIVYTKTQTAPAGNFSTVINVANLSPGTYVLKTTLGSKVYGKKVLIIR